MTPLEREKLESLKSKLSNENLSEEARTRAAKKLWIMQINFLERNKNF